MTDFPQKQGLYNPANEHDACGIGAIANIKGEKSHEIVNEALDILVNLEHRGGAGAENNSGDGAGILVQIPHKLFKNQSLGFEIGEEEDYAVAQLFLSRNEAHQKEAYEIIKNALTISNIELLGFREVPINPLELGKTAYDAMPFIVQVFVKRPEKIQKGLAFEQLLYLIRRVIEKKAQHIPKFYFCSFSSRTIVYKGMLLSTQVKNFYLDLMSRDMETAIALVHSRFSTNTFPSWEKAHPNRFIAHNGEINTIRGNVDAILSREGLFKSEVFQDRLSDILPVVSKPSSDSAMLDNVLEFFYMNGRSLEEIVMTLIPEPWSKNHDMPQDIRAFYEYYSTMMEPWDGPASIIFTDGVRLGASLDRNGLRPSRFYLTKDNRFILFSETGAVKIDEENIVAKKRLEPGKLVLVDTEKGAIIDNYDLKENIVKKNPYQKWVKEIVKLDTVKTKAPIAETKDVLRKALSFGYTYDEWTGEIMVMAEKHEEPIVSMGDDTPIAVLSKRYQPLYCFFKQLFAQVTNPPIDSIRESIITSSRMYLGCEGNILNPDSKSATRIKINSPILIKEDMEKIYSLKDSFKIHEIDITFDIHNRKLFDAKRNNMEERLDEIFHEAEKAIDDGAEILVLTDVKMDQDHAAIPLLLVTSGLHSYLTRVSKRTHASIIAFSGEPRSVHHAACLLGFGATAIYPYVAYGLIEELIKKDMLKLDYATAVENYRMALNKGIIKIISKMGLSTIQSYDGAELFEIMGLSDDVVEKYFTNTNSSIGGIDLVDIMHSSIDQHRKGYETEDFRLQSEGLHGFRQNKEEHLFDPLAIYHLQKATREGNYEEFKKFTSLIKSKKVNIRDVMDFNDAQEISIDDVEPVESIVKRFKTGAMSYGSISKEAHECLALAMNMLGGKSNTGEGGEDRNRYTETVNGVSKCSKIKQVASGRFGVTIEYLASAEEIQIKMAQGAKPGEGGQLPGPKVYPHIASARHSTPGVQLISPPPHHDIYSIEDLAQLIFDLKNANPHARITVKLVCESGVGTVAAGVVKAGANTICISGYDGGTGASPRTSIKNAGIPWEIGLAEAHQTLILNRLRDRVRLETDGKILTGRDLAIATLLGAEEFGFATGPLISLGCVMMRVCNLDTCPVGIATQNECLRGRFKGRPEYVVNFMRFIAAELREYMAQLGFRTIDEMVGRMDMLKKMDNDDSKIDLSKILYRPESVNKTSVHFKEIKPSDLEKTLDQRVIIPLCKKAILNEEEVKLNLNITNVNRSLGTTLSYEITKHYKEKGLKEDTIYLRAHGNAGNSFGAFTTNGITLHVFGDSNDYLGKGLCGGKIYVQPCVRFTGKPEENIIVGNVALYGAIKGTVLLDGLAGERFAVRNSGATAVVLGVGDHALEYMTGGKVLILGKTGKNLAAGMSGGIGYVFGRENIKNINMSGLKVEDLTDNDVKEIKNLMQLHISKTESKYVSKMLNDFKAEDYFKIVPIIYEKVHKYMDEFRALNATNPELEAFLKLQKEAK